MTEPANYLHKDEVEKRIGDIKSFFYLLRFARPYAGQFTLAFTLIFFSGLTMIVSARLMGVMIEQGLVARDFSRAGRQAGAILVLEMLSILFIWRGRRSLAQASSEAILLIRKTIFQHIHSLPISFYDRQPEGRTVTRMTHDVEGIEEFFTSSLGRLSNSVITFFISLGAMVFTDLKLGLMLVASLLPAIFMMFLTRDRVRFLNREVSKANSACNARLSEYLKGFWVIRAFGLEGWSKKNYQEVVERHLNWQLVANTYYGWTRPVTNLLCAAPLLMLLGVGGREVFAGTLSIGLFVTFIRYCERFSHPIVALTREIHVIQQAFTSAERVTIFLNSEKEEDVLGKDGEIRPENLQGHLVFQDVTMGYDGENMVLGQMSFEIAPGEKIGMVGATGSGKTTTVSLLARLYDYQRGQILLDGRSLRDYRRNDLRENLGLVSQDVIIFKGSLRENLTCEARIGDDLILEATRKTGLYQVMKKNGQNLDTEILDGGANLSAGERQLLSLTRVLLKNPTILILDEATSSVDPHYEKIIHEAVEEVMKGRTCLMIAHRLETLKNCDRILVFKEGRLVEMGTHQELMSRKGYFFGLQQNGTAAVPGILDKTPGFL